MNWTSNFLKQTKKLVVAGCSYSSVKISTINGQTKVIINGEVIFDAKSSEIATVEVNGNVDNLICGPVTVNGSVHEIDSSGSVTCGEVSGDIDAAGSVTCKDVKGNIDVAGSIKCGAVQGNVDAMGSVRMTK